MPYRLDAASVRVARSWVSLGEGVEWSLSGSPRVVNGRHRLWAAHRLPGVTALPLRIDTLSVLPDALVDLGDEDYRVRIAQATRDELALVGATLVGIGTAHDGPAPATESWPR